MIRRYSKLALALVLLGAMSAPAFAGIVVYENEEKNKKVEIGARLQLQYHSVDPDGGDTSDELFFRRLRPYIAGSVTENWWGKFQFDIGKASGDNELAVKDAFMQYKGWDWGSLKIGNAKPGFSREFMTSSKKQQMVERSFVGDHNYGTPDRVLGFHLAGSGADKTIEWQASFGSAAHDPDLKKMDFDTPVNQSGDWNTGYIFVGSLDWNPLGELKKEQYDFSRDKTRFGFRVAGFTWSNDDDELSYGAPSGCDSSSKCDLETASGFELSAAFRGAGLAIDAEYQSIQGELYDGTVTKGLFENGETTLDKFAIEGGWMFPSNNFEIIAGYESLDADNYESAWNRTSIGLNYFWSKEKVRAQLTYRIGENLNGVEGADTNETFLQLQYVF